MESFFTDNWQYIVAFGGWVILLAQNYFSLRSARRNLSRAHDLAASTAAWERRFEAYSAFEKTASEVGKFFVQSPENRKVLEIEAELGGLSKEFTDALAEMTYPMNDMLYGQRLGVNSLHLVSSPLTSKICLVMSEVLDRFAGINVAIRQASTNGRALNEDELQAYRSIREEYTAKSAALMEFMRRDLAVHDLIDKPRRTLFRRLFWRSRKGHLTLTFPSSEVDDVTLPPVGADHLNHAVRTLD